MKKKHSSDEQRAWLNAVLNQPDLALLKKDQLILQVGIGTILQLLTENINNVNSEINETREKLNNIYDIESVLKIQSLFLKESQLFEAHDCIDAILRGAKHPIQRYIDAARSIFGGNKLSYREIRFRCICIGFMENYQEEFDSSVLKSAKITVDTLEGFVPRNLSSAAVKNYFDNRESLGNYAENEVPFFKEFFANVCKTKPNDLFLELRFYAASSISADSVRRLFALNNPELLRTPPSSHQS